LIFINISYTIGYKPMSKLTELSEARHFKVTDEELRKRFDQLIKHHHLPIARVTYFSHLTETKFEPRAFICCDFSGRTFGNDFEGSEFLNPNFSGHTEGNNLREADILGGVMGGGFVGNKFRGAYIRHVDISDAKFRQGEPQRIMNDDSITVHKETGRIVFCSGVENSMIKPEQVATFRPINLNFLQSLPIPFLARLYFDGEHRKLALISQEDILFLGQSGQTSRMWPGFVYTLTNESAELRTEIEEDIIKDSANLSEDQSRVLQALEYSMLGRIALRPARPLDIYYLDEHIESIDPVIKDFISRIKV